MVSKASMKSFEGLNEKILNGIQSFNSINGSTRNDSSSENTVTPVTGFGDVLITS